MCSFKISCKYNPICGVYESPCTNMVISQHGFISYEEPSVTFYIDLIP